MVNRNLSSSIINESQLDGLHCIGGHYWLQTTTTDDDRRQQANQLTYTNPDSERAANGCRLDTVVQSMFLYKLMCPIWVIVCRNVVTKTTISSLLLIETIVRRLEVIMRLRGGAVLIQMLTGCHVRYRVRCFGCCWWRLNSIWVLTRIRPLALNTITTINANTNTTTIIIIIIIIIISLSCAQIDV